MVEILRETLACPRCNSDNTIRKDKSSTGAKRYLCKDCDRSFSEYYATPEYRSQVATANARQNPNKLDEFTIKRIASLHSCNLDQNTIADTLSIHKSTVQFHLRELGLTKPRSCSIEPVKLISPTGESITIPYGKIPQFCEENNLNVRSFRDFVNNRPLRSNKNWMRYKGWKIADRTITRPKPALITPEKRNYLFKKHLAFCDRLAKIHYSSYRKLGTFNEVQQLVYLAALRAIEIYEARNGASIESYIRAWVDGNLKNWASKQAKYNQLHSEFNDAVKYINLLTHAPQEGHH